MKTKKSKVIMRRRLRHPVPFRLQRPPLCPGVRVALKDAEAAFQSHIKSCTRCTGQALKEAARAALERVLYQ